MELVVGKGNDAINWTNHLKKLFPDIDFHPVQLKYYDTKSKEKFITVNTIYMLFEGVNRSIYTTPGLRPGSPDRGIFATDVLYPYIYNIIECCKNINHIVIISPGLSNDIIRYFTETLTILGLKNIIICDGRLEIPGPKKLLEFPNIIYPGPGPKHKHKKCEIL